MYFLKTKLLILVLLFLSACVAKSIHLVANPIPHGNSQISLSNKFKAIKNKKPLEGISIYVKNRVGAAIGNYIIINESSKASEKLFFGENHAINKIASSSELINKITFTTKTYSYDNRKRTGGELMELVEHAVSRSCGAIKMYTSDEHSIQIAYGVVTGCGELQMSLANFKKFKIADLLEHLDKSAKTAFTINGKK